MVGGGGPRCGDYTMVVLAQRLVEAIKRLVEVVEVTDME